MVELSVIFQKAIARLTQKSPASVTSRVDYLVMCFFLQLSLYLYFLLFYTPFSVVCKKEYSLSRYSVSQRAIEQHHPGDGQA